MASKITDQQRAEVLASRGQQVVVEDDQAHKIYYLVAADYLHANHEQLKVLIEEGIQSRHIPAMEAEVELRRYADQLGVERS